MSKSIQVSGSIALILSCNFKGTLKKIWFMIQIGFKFIFFCPEMKREFGGCAANIAYNLRLLDQECILLGSVGSDGKEYLKKIKNLVSIRFCEINDGLFTAQAIITTDANGNQLTSFHPGAMGSAGRLVFLIRLQALELFLPTVIMMVRHAKEFRRKIYRLFLIPQALPMFSKEDIVNLSIYHPGWR